MTTSISRRAFLAGSGGLVAMTVMAAENSSKSATMPEQFELERFVDDASRANADGQHAVDEVLARAVSHPAASSLDWENRGTRAYTSCITPAT